MTQREDGRGADAGSPLATVEERVLRAARRAAQARQGAAHAQRSAADSMQRSAESQERIARAYEEAAASSGHRDEYLERASRHRDFARDDHLMARELRQLADAEWTDHPVVDTAAPNGPAGIELGPICGE